MNITHGLGRRGNKRHPLFIVWLNMRQRCYYPKAIKYGDYGGRGISVCGAWLTSVDVFYNWCMRNGWEPGLEIDRVDNNGNYNPSNCRFVDRKTNMRNRRSTLIITHNGISKPLIEWSEIIGVKYSTLKQRIFKLNMPLGKALSNTMY